MRWFPIALALALSPIAVQAKAVFAHFMVGNTASYTQADWLNDIKLAQAASIDAFALNMAYDEDTTRSQLPSAFSAAESVGFKLFFSFDYAGNGAWNKEEVIDLIQLYSGRSAYYHRGSQSFVSTFEGPGNAKDWIDIKAQTGCFFMPDWSSLGARDAMALGTADGLFNWAAWPVGPQKMDTYSDASYFEFLKGKPYMAPVSPWFYTNMPGYSKNWMWRGDSLWFDRWQQLIVGEQQPEFLQIISWNDYGESHYIGPLNDKSYVAFETGRAPYNYVLDMPHDGWRNFLPYVIQLWKTGTATVTREGVVGWYRKNPATACSDGGTTGNTASQLQMEYTPSQITQDRVFFSALLGKEADVKVTIGGASTSAQWTTKPTPNGGVGIYHGSAPTNGATGEVIITISRNGATVVQMIGRDIRTGCPTGLNNYNAWVGAFWGNTITPVSPATKIADQVCTEGFGANNFNGLCSFTCSYGYCPESACTCTQMGAQKTKPKSTGVKGYPLPGASPSYGGLCDYACNLGYCPSSACGTVDAGTVIPTTSPFLAPACTGGTGPGHYVGLCQYACNWGFCPIHLCTCTSTGNLNVPIQPNTTIKAYSTDTAVDDRGICAFACQRGYCPDPCKIGGGTLPGGGFIEIGDDNNGLAWPLLTVQKDYTQVHLDAATSDIVEKILRDVTCPVKVRRDTLETRANIEDCIVSFMAALAASPQYVSAVIELYRGNPIPGLVRNMETLPKWSVEAQQAAFVRSVIIGAGLLEASMSALAATETIWTVYATMNIAIQSLWNHPLNFENFAVGRSGSMQLTCPAKSEITCDHSLCDGGDNELCTGFFSPCACTKSDCPTKDNGKLGLFCNEASCGGVNTETGRCQKRSCACIGAPEEEPYLWVDQLSAWNQVFKDYHAITDGGDFVPPNNTPKPEPDEIKCRKKASGVLSDPAEWKFVDQKYLDDDIVTFCKSLGSLNNAAGNSYTQTFRSDNLNHVIIYAEWEGGTSLSNDDCLAQLRALSANCDWHPTENQYNWKWGGEFLKGKVRWVITPQKNRAAIRHDPDTDWWREGDSSHWVEINTETPRNDINKPRFGNNGEPYDMVILHQCLAEMRRNNWGAGNFDCAGLVNFYMSAWLSYESWTTCWDNTWQAASWRLVHEGAITFDSYHKGGSGSAGTRCWLRVGA